ncbi:zinc-binding dehydrogenase [SAR202 cluster bacterium AD-802-E10_MRT_200m]|nr:zinc-binding dehydrogenase [SAR202 cluster bacterium AD-802-E10_MRT_200m]MQF82787.1 zinc-binding dehydrogenase [SAR202 cluster bacterium AD-802-E10_MRT_200m]
MKAVYITEHGGSEALKYGDMPEPEVGPRDVKVAVKACALNRLDLYTRAGARGTRRRTNEPLILGCDASGEIVEVGEDVFTIKVGDRVVLDPAVTCGQCQQCLAGNDSICSGKRSMLGATVNGGYAEYVVAPASNAFRIPDVLGFEEAASLPTTFMPVWRIIVRQGQLKPHETALILSASSGVGTAAIQVAKNVIGARVITTTSTLEKATKARDLGADEVIVYTEESISERVKELTEGRGVDLVVDHVGSEFWNDAYSSLTIGGRYGVCGVTTGYEAQLHMGQLFSKQLTVFGVFMGGKEDFRQVVDAVRRNLLHGTVSEKFPLADAVKAHEAMEERSFFGKIVLTVP